MTVRAGIDVLLDTQIGRVAGRRIGLITSPASVDSRLTSSVERLYRHPGVQLAALFGAEHGIRGSAQAGTAVATTTDAQTGLPAYSLYGETRKPTATMLAGLDALVYDLQDAGARFYTYASTLVHALEAAAEHGIELIVLDRPNPISGQTPEGTLLDPAYRSFVGMAPVPMRHALTAGELALLCNDALSIGAKLTVVTMDGWRRAMWFDQTGLPFVLPSPNLPTLDSLTAYAGTCLIEGTNLSEGRGTTRPFELIGAPWLDRERLARDLNALDLPGVRWRAAAFVPSFSKFQGEVCGGVQLHVLDRAAYRAAATALHLLETIKAHYPAQFEWLAPATGAHRHIDLLAGTNRLREHLDTGHPAAELIAAQDNDLRAYEQRIAPFLLYPD